MPKFTQSVFFIFLILCGLLGFYQSGRSNAAVLDQFDIKTIDAQNVQIILHTDERTTYETRNGASGFNLILKDTALSAKNIQQGLPVVVDNENRFIGRAVPEENNQVRVIIPNLNPDNVTVSVIHHKTPAIEPMPTALNTKQPSALAPNKVKPTQIRAVDKNNKVAVQAVRTESQFSSIAKQLNTLQSTKAKKPQPAIIKEESFIAEAVQQPSEISPKENKPQKSTRNNKQKNKAAPLKTRPAASVQQSKSIVIPQDKMATNTPVFLPENTPQYRFAEWQPEQSVISITPETYPAVTPLPEEVFDPPINTVTVEEVDLNNIPEPKEVGLNTVVDQLTNLPIWLVGLVVAVLIGAVLFMMTGVVLMARFIVTPFNQQTVHHHYNRAQAPVSHPVIKQKATVLNKAKSSVKTKPEAGAVKPQPIKKAAARSAFQSVLSSTALPPVAKKVDMPQTEPKQNNPKPNPNPVVDLPEASTSSLKDSIARTMMLKFPSKAKAKSRQKVSLF